MNNIGIITKKSKNRIQIHLNLGCTVKDIKKYNIYIWYNNSGVQEDINSAENRISKNIKAEVLPLETYFTIDDSLVDNAIVNEQYAFTIDIKNKRIIDMRRI